MKRLPLFFLIAAILGMTVFNVGISLFVACAFIFIALLVVRRQDARIILLSCMIIFILTFLRMENLTNKTTTLNIEDGNQIITGRIVSFPIVKDDYVQFVLQLHGEQKEKVQVFNYENTKTFSYGDIITCEAEVENPSPKRNPGGFDYNKYLRSKKIYAVAYAVDSSVEISDHSVSFFENMAVQLRQKMLDHMDANFSEVERDYITGIILGEKSIDDDIEEEFNILGVSHILSVSGLHVGYVYLFVRGITSLFHLNNKIEFAVVSIVLYFYCFMVGFNEPAMRASLMFLLSLFAQVLDKKYDALNALCLIATIYIVNNPFILYNAGFQLSYSAVLAIIVIYPYLNHRFTLKEKLPEYIKSTVILTLSVQVGTLPIILYHFNNLPLHSIIANLIIVPLSGFILIGYLVVFIVSSILNTTPPVLVFPIREAIRFTLDFSAKLSRLPVAALKLSPMPLLLVSLYYILILYLLGYFYHYKRENRNRLISFVAIHLLCLLFVNIQPKLLTITFLDVGQGDSAIIECPNGYTMLIDGGGSVYRPVGDDVVAKALLAKNIRELDAVVATHSDGDHIQGLMEIMDDVKIHELIINPNEEENYGELIAACEQYGINVRRSDEAVLRGGEEVDIAFIYPHNGEAYSNANNSSVVTKINYKSQNFLFMGDLEVEGEEMLLEENEDLKSDLIKIGHHGSKTSTSMEFIEKVNPKCAIISVGENNYYNHPSDNVINLLEEEEITIYRTDEHGAIELETDGESVSIRPTID